MGSTKVKLGKEENLGVLQTELARANIRLRTAQRAGAAQPAPI